MHTVNAVNREVIENISEFNVMMTDLDHLGGLSTPNHSTTQCFLSILIPVISTPSKA